MAARDGERMSRQVWREVPGTSALEWVCGPLKSPEGDSPRADEGPQEEE